jgi:hypothetical protein
MGRHPAPVEIAAVERAGFPVAGYFGGVGGVDIELDWRESLHQSTGSLFSSSASSFL